MQLEYSHGMKQRWELTLIEVVECGLSQAPAWSRLRHVTKFYSQVLRRWQGMWRGCSLLKNNTAGSSTGIVITARVPLLKSLGLGIAYSSGKVPCLKAKHFDTVSEKRLLFCVLGRGEKDPDFQKCCSEFNTRVCNVIMAGVRPGGCDTVQNVQYQFSGRHQKWSISDHTDRLKKKKKSMGGVQIYLFFLESVLNLDSSCLVVSSMQQLVGSLQILGSIIGVIIGSVQRRHCGPKDMFLCFNFVLAKINNRLHKQRCFYQGIRQIQC